MMRGTATAKKLHVLIYGLFILTSVLCFLKAEKVFEKSASPDLLLRVIGARLMQDKQPVYFYKWRQGDPGKYYHFNQRYNQVVNGITVTPAVLRLHSKLTTPSFCQAKTTWFYLECLLLFSTGLLMIILLKDNIAKVLAGIIFFLFYGFSQNFYFHLECSQIYLLYSFFFGVYYLLLRRSTSKSLAFLALLVVLLSTLRPFFILLLLPLLLLKNKRQVLIGSALGVLLFAAQLLTSGDLHYWREYSKAMTEYSKEIIGETTFVEAGDPAFPTEPIACVYPIVQQEKHSAGALYPAQKYLQDFGFKTSNSMLFASCLLVACIGLCGFYRARQGLGSIEQQLVLLYLVYLAAELLAPAIRYPYNMVQWLVPSIIIIGNIRNNKWAGALLIVGLLLNHELPISVKYGRELGEMLMIAGALLFLMKKNEQTKVATYAEVHHTA